MLRGAIGKALWVGRATSAIVGLAVILALILGLASAALGASGDSFILGVLNNKATDVTRLTGNVSGKPALHVVNPNTGAGSKALQLTVADKRSPLTVNAARGGTPGKAVNLNADKLDGQEASEFLGKTKTAADAAALGGKAPADYQPRVKWARVIASGGTPTISGSRGAVGVTRVNAGIYKVEFDEDVANTCSIIGSLNSGSATGFIKAGAGGTGDPQDTVLVETIGTNGAFMDNHFYVTVLC